METSDDGAFAGLRDFRIGHGVPTALIEPAAGMGDFIDWFRDRHVPAVLTLPGIGSAGLSGLHQAQSPPYPAEYPLVAVYGLTDIPAALRHGTRGTTAGAAPRSTHGRPARRPTAGTPGSRDWAPRRWPTPIRRPPGPRNGRAYGMAAHIWPRMR